MPRKEAEPKEIEFYELDSFACMSGFDFMHGGNAVIHFAFPEVERFLDALIDIEREAPKSSDEVLNALKTAKELIVKRYYGRSRSPEYNIEAICPISQGAVRLEPVIQNVSLMSETKKKQSKVKKSRLSSNRSHVIPDHADTARNA